MSIPRDKMTELQSADDILTVASQSEEDKQLEAIAYTINNAANCGSSVCTWTGIMLDGVLAELEAKGYTVEPQKQFHNYEAVGVYTITAKPANS